jgi:hypothetical protein
MSWAAAAIARLERGEGTTVRPRGHSMAGRVEDGETVTLAPLAGRAIEVGDVVLVRVRGRVYLHLVKAVQGDRVLIGNNRGGTNGWVNRAAVYGIAVLAKRGGGRVEAGGRSGSGWAAVSGRACRMRRPARGATSAASSVTTATVSPSAVRNSTS